MARRGLGVGWWVFATGLLLLGMALWFVFAAQSVVVQVNPEPDALQVSGLTIPLGSRWLMLQGEHDITAKKQGYHPLAETVSIERGEDNHFFFTLKKLPGRLRVTSKPAGAAISIRQGDEERAAAVTPSEEISLEAGRYQLMLRADRHEVLAADIVIEGMDQLQTLDYVLVPAWAEITISSRPADAVILIDGKAQGKTPATVEVGAGEHQLALRLPGFQTWQKTLNVVANQPQTLPVIKLQPALGKIVVQSSPTGAAVTLNGKFSGSTPATLTVTPNKPMAVKLSKPGYQSAEAAVQARSGETKTLKLDLQPILGAVKFSATPADAELLINGKSRGAANQTLNLVATTQNIEIRKPGFKSYKTTVTPRPGFLQTVEATLQTPQQAKAASTPSVITTATGQRLKLIQPGRFTMGSPRREQGRQANESYHDVELTKAFYLGTHEVTNEAFREFRPRHSSGIVARTTLDNDNYPVVRVSWADAIAYCNWLSKKDGLPPAYQNGQLITPVTTGYRLPTEAEWAWAARFAGNRRLKYPWGGKMPPAANAGNFADVSAASLLDKTLQSYTDGHAAAAPVGRFLVNALGIYDLGGNVAEWVNDVYAGVQIITRPQTDPLGLGTAGAHVVRGSSWRHGRITELRLAYRDTSNSARDDLGFRIARYAD